MTAFDPMYSTSPTALTLHTTTTRHEGFALIRPFLAPSASTTTHERALRALCIHFRTPLRYWTSLHKTRATNLLVAWRLHPRSGSISSLHHHLHLPVTLTESQENEDWIEEYTIEIDPEFQQQPNVDGSWDEETWQRSVDETFAPHGYSDEDTFDPVYEDEVWYEDSSDPNDPEAVPF